MRKHMRRPQAVALKEYLKARLLATYEFAKTQTEPNRQGFRIMERDVIAKQIGYTPSVIDAVEDFYLVWGVGRNWRQYSKYMVADYETIKRFAVTYDFLGIANHKGHLIWLNPKCSIAFSKAKNKHKTITEG